MDIGPTELPIRPVFPSNGIRRVEGRSDANQYPQRRQAGEEETPDQDQDSPQDSVDVSDTYRLAHAKQPGSENGETAEAGADTRPFETHLDIEA